jgi:hypothetical protein
MAPSLPSWSAEGGKHRNPGYGALLFDNLVRKMQAKTMTNPLHASEARPAFVRFTMWPHSATPLAFGDLPRAIRTGIMDVQDMGFSEYLELTIYEHSVLVGGINRDDVRRAIARLQVCDVPMLLVEPSEHVGGEDWTSGISWEESAWKDEG